MTPVLVRMETGCFCTLTGVLVSLENHHLEPKAPDCGFINDRTEYMQMRMVTQGQHRTVVDSPREDIRTRMQTETTAHKV